MRFLLTILVLFVSKTVYSQIALPVTASQYTKTIDSAITLIKITDTAVYNRLDSMVDVVDMWLSAFSSCDTKVSPAIIAAAAESMQGNNDEDVKVLQEKLESLKQIPGNDAAAAEAERQKIRDKYAALQAQMDAAQTPDQLKSLMPQT